MSNLLKFPKNKQFTKDYPALKACCDHILNQDERNPYMFDSQLHNLCLYFGDDMVEQAFAIVQKPYPKQGKVSSFWNRK